MKIKSVRNFISKRKMLERARHPFEIPLFILSTLISVAIYGILFYATVYMKDKGMVIQWLNESWPIGEDVATIIVNFGKDILIVVFGIIMVITIWSYFRDIGSAAARDVHVSETQSAIVEELFDNYSEEMGLLIEPSHCLCKELKTMEVFSVPIKNKYCVRIPAVYVFNAVDVKHDYSCVRFIIANELSHIALSHRNLILLLLTFPAQLIPIFSAFFSRIMTYSADRLTAEIIGEEETIKGIIWDENNLDFAKFVLDFDDYQKKLFEKRSGITKFAKIIENLSSDKPIPEYRIKKIQSRKKKHNGQTR